METMRSTNSKPARRAAGVGALRPERGARQRAAHVLPRLAVAAALLVFVVSCGEDVPTSLGGDQRTHPDSLRSVALAVVEYTVFDDSLEISLRNSPRAQLGSQGPYTSHLLLDFQVPTFVLDDAEMLELSEGTLKIDFELGERQQYQGTVQLSLHEVAATGWTNPDTILRRVPELQPGPPAWQDTVSCSRPGFEMSLDPTLLVDFESAVQDSAPLDVHVACLFNAFTIGGPGFIDLPYRSFDGSSNVSFVGIYGTRRIERTFAPETTLTVVEFDSTYSPGPNLVVSDGHRWHTYVRFENVEALLPPSAFVHRAELLLSQADRGDSIFGSGPEIGVMVPRDTSVIFTKAENQKALAFRAPLQAPPEIFCESPTVVDSGRVRVTIPVSAYLFDQQEGSVNNHGMLLRLSSEGTKARHFEFFGPTAADSTRRPRIRITYGMPADFGGGAP
jgi:hypothetical protein